MTWRLLADENFNGAIVAGLGRTVDRLDLVRVQDVGLRTLDDPTILDWAASEGRVLLTHDMRTIPDFAHSRVAQGLPMPGAFIVRLALPVGMAVHELATIMGASEPPEWVDRVVYLPVR